MSGTALGMIAVFVTTAVVVFAQPTRSRAAPPNTEPGRDPRETRVLTFNIRNSGAFDFRDAWRFRRDFLVETIRDLDADVIGLQEVLADQADFIREQLPEYGFVGTGRDDGERAGEFSPILFRLSRYELIGSGQSWLSDSPDVIASVGWDAALPRIMTWAALRDRETGDAMLVANTHWDHLGQRARVESARLMRRLIAALSRPVEADEPLPIVVVGDFNCTEDDEPYRALLGESDPTLLDTYRAVHPTPAAEEASYNGFNGQREGKRIDWILVSRDWAVTDATIDRRANDAGRYPSDHYPVTATLRPHEGLAP